MSTHTTSQGNTDHQPGDVVDGKVYTYGHEWVEFPEPVRSRHWYTALKVITPIVGLIAILLPLVLVWAAPGISHTYVLALVGATVLLACITVAVGDHVRAKPWRAVVRNGLPPVDQP